MTSQLKWTHKMHKCTRHCKHTRMRRDGWRHYHSCSMCANCKINVEQLKVRLHSVSPPPFAPNGDSQFAIQRTGGYMTQNNRFDRFPLIVVSSYVFSFASALAMLHRSSRRRWTTRTEGELYKCEMNVTLLRWQCARH